MGPLSPRLAVVLSDQVIIGVGAHELQGLDAELCGLKGQHVSWCREALT